jgi:hypothetical protein
MNERTTRDHLRSSLLQFAEATAATLGSRFPQLPYLREAFEVTDHTVTSVQQPDWLITLFAAQDVLLKLPEFDLVVAESGDDPVISEHVKRGYTTSLGGATLDSQTWVLALVAQSLIAPDRPTIDRAKFNTAFDDLMTFFDQSEIPMVGVAPLHGIDLPVVPLQPANDITLTALTKEERNLHWEQWGRHASALGVGPLGRERYVARISVVIPKWIGFSEQRPDLEHPYNFVERRLQHLMSAIRLLRTGQVGFTQLELRPERWCPFVGGQRNARLNAPHISFRGITVREDDLADLQAHLALVSDVITSPDLRLAVALGRFNLCIERLELPDRLVDAIVGLEALFLDEGAELSFRLSLRAAASISTDKSQRIAAYGFLRAAYALRSSILHGKIPNADINVAGQTVTPEELLTELTDILRRSLLQAMLPANRNSKKWLAHIDAEILAGPTTAL